MLQFDLVSHAIKQREASLAMKGDGPRERAITLRMKETLEKIVANPRDPEAMADMLLLSTEGAWRGGTDPEVFAMTVSRRFREAMEVSHVKAPAATKAEEPKRTLTRRPRKRRESVYKKRQQFRAQMLPIIQPMIDNGASQSAIAALMNAAGYRTLYNKKWSQNAIHRLVYDK